MNKHDLLILADHLELNIPSRLFNMDSWGNDPYEPIEDHKDCGTPACIGGHARILFNIIPNEEDGLVVALANYFDLSLSVGHGLFLSYRESCRGVTPFGYRDISPAEAAKIIRHLVATGEVKWSLLKEPEEDNAELSVF